MALSLDRGFVVFVGLVFFNSGTSLLFSGADLRPRLPAPEKIGDQLHRAWEIEDFDFLNERDDVAASARADPAPFCFVPAPGRVIVSVSRDGAVNMGGFFLRRPADPEPAQKLDFPAVKGGLRLINRKTGLSVAQGNRFPIRVFDNAGKLPR